MKERTTMKNKKILITVLGSLIVVSSLYAATTWCETCESTTTGNCQPGATGSCQITYNPNGQCGSIGLRCNDPGQNQVTGWIQNGTCEYSQVGTYCAANTGAAQVATLMNPNCQ
jgi:hypothetical protein